MVSSYPFLPWAQTININSSYGVLPTCQLYLRRGPVKVYCPPLTPAASTSSFRCTAHLSALPGTRTVYCPPSSPAASASSLRCTAQLSVLPGTRTVYCPPSSHAASTSSLRCTAHLNTLLPLQTAQALLRQRLCYLFSTKVYCPSLCYSYRQL